MKKSKLLIAGRDVGHLLKSILHHDKKRIFDTESGYTRKYRWTEKK